MYHWHSFHCGQVSLCIGYSTWRGGRCSVRGWPEFRWAESILRSFTSQLPWQPDSFIKYNLHCFLSEPVNLPVTWTVDDLCALSTEGGKREREKALEDVERYSVSLSLSPFVFSPSSVFVFRWRATITWPWHRWTGVGARFQEVLQLVFVQGLGEFKRACNWLTWNRIPRRDWRNSIVTVYADVYN